MLSHRALASLFSAPTSTPHALASPSPAQCAARLKRWPPHHNDWAAALGGAWGAVWAARQGVRRGRRGCRQVLACFAQARQREEDEEEEETLRSLKERELALMRELESLRKKKRLRLASRRLRIAIVGFGTFGQFLCRTFARSHDVIVASRTRKDALAAEHGAMRSVGLDELAAFFAEDLDVCLLSISILSFEATLLGLVPHLRGRDLLVVDVLSVKEYPRELLLKHLPPSCDILSTHPMFGPQSGGGPSGWRGLNFVYDVVRSNAAVNRVDVLDRFLSIWEEEGCRMVPMSCGEHDRYAASSQFITHLVGRVLGDQHLKPTPIDTTGFRSLLGVVTTTNADSFDLFYGLFKYNANSQAIITSLRTSLGRTVDALERACDGDEDCQIST